MLYQIFDTIFLYLGPSCETPVDLAFILDSSGSLKDEYHKEKEFINEVISTFDIGEDKSRAGVVTFSQDAELSIQLNSHYEIASLKDAVETIPLMGNTTRIDKALRLAQDLVFLERNGGRVGLPKVLILLTDGSQTEGEDQEDPVHVANEIRASGIKLLVIGIGSGIDRAELIKIGGGDRNVFTAASFDQLIEGKFIQKISTGSCAEAKSSIVAHPEGEFDGMIILLYIRNYKIYIISAVFLTSSAYGLMGQCI